MSPGTEVQRTANIIKTVSKVKERKTYPGIPNPIGLNQGYDSESKVGTLIDMMRTMVRFVVTQNFGL